MTASIEVDLPPLRLEEEIVFTGPTGETVEKRIRYEVTLHEEMPLGDDD